MARIGTIYFQAQEESDVFHSVELFEDGITDPSEQLIEVVEPDFGQFVEYLQGRVPKFIPVQIEGDSAVVTGWLKEDSHTFNYTITIYLEYEETARLEAGKNPDDEIEDKGCRVL